MKKCLENVRRGRAELGCAVSLALLAGGAEVPESIEGVEEEWWVSDHGIEIGFT